jgi:hypothetical protein
MLPSLTTMNTAMPDTPDVQPSTGLPGLDRILHGLRPGDNIVWQTECIENYLPLVKPFCAYAKAHGVRLVYFRFAIHQELVAEEPGVRVCRLDPRKGVEEFITEIQRVIEQMGRGVYYVFDSLSELALDCFSERMIGNFFMLTCPYLLSLDAIAYFMVLRHYHSHHAALPIERTTQLLLDVYSHGGKTYVHPLKVDQRHAPTMFMLHAWEGDEFVPVTESPTISDVVTSGPWHGLESASYRMVGLWDRRFIQAEEVLESHLRNECSPELVEKTFHHQLTQLISRDDRILSLARKYLTLSDLIYIWKRTIGSGLVGGKSVGMLLARAILKASDPRWADVLEAHDSFYIGSDIFYSFLVENRCWWIRQKQKDPATLLDGSEEGRKRILNGRFPDYIVKRFSDMLDYFGQCPIIVRSSSLLEDNFGNAFSGKYESVFCTNRGMHEERLEEFLDAVRKVYASTMSEEALLYRAKRGVLDRDEQMALLVQRVSGARYGSTYLPHLAGVGMSYNSYVWDADIKPEAGLLRLVFGMGTRAVDRHDDDYTRLVALNAPAKCPEGDIEEIRRHAQKKVDFLDLAEGAFRSGYFVDLAQNSPGLCVDLFAPAERGQDGVRHTTLTFDRVSSDTSFMQDMRKMLCTLRDVYRCHVDIEFTANFAADNTYRINLLQCRPFQVRCESAEAGAIPEVAAEDLILKVHGGIIGTSRALSIDRIIYVVPRVYGHLPEQERYAVARLIGRITRRKETAEPMTVMLVGPGRWGTRMSSLGVPVSFSEINTVAVICELGTMHEGLTPDLSLGTHYFNDMVEMDMLYMAFHPDREGNVLNEDYLTSLTNRLADLVPEAATMAEAVRVIHAEDMEKHKRIRLSVDSMKQTAVLYTSAT